MSFAVTLPNHVTYIGSKVVLQNERFILIKRIRLILGQSALPEGGGGRCGGAGLAGGALGRGGGGRFGSSPCNAEAPSN